MKLRNKKTGEIVDLSEGFIRDTYNGAMIQIKPIAISNKEGYVYDSLAELNKEWEDYEDPKNHWHIGCEGDVFIDNTERYLKSYSSIGNNFETKEEAEKAVEKLKALERLQKKFNFHITGWDVIDTQVIITTDCDFDYVKDRQDDGLWSDLDLVFNGNLLFGGEE